MLLRVLYFIIQIVLICVCIKSKSNLNINLNKRIFIILFPVTFQVIIFIFLVCNMTKFNPENIGLCSLPRKTQKNDRQNAKTPP